MEPRIDETARPKRVGPYRLEEPIGRGGMGTVWRAWDERLKRQVAIKHIRREKPLDGRSDLFSLGSLLYELLTGEPPFRGANPAASLASIVSVHPPPLATVCPGVPQELSDLIGRLLEKDCRSRPQSAREMAAALAVLAEAPPPGESDLPSTIAERRPILASTSFRGASGISDEVAQIASVIGRTFSPDLLAAIAPLDAEALRQGLEELVQADLVHRRGLGRKVRYSFKHTLIQDAAYASLLSRDRQELHLKIAQALEAEPTEAGLLAHHWARAVSPRHPEPALVRRAVPSLLAAGEHTLRLGAYQEARAHLEAALGLVRMLPDDSERDEQELPLLVLLCRTLQASLGYTSPEVAGVYERARGLRLRLGDRREISQILYMLWVSRLFEGDHGQAPASEVDWIALQSEKTLKTFGAEAPGADVLDNVVINTILGQKGADVDAAIDEYIRVKNARPFNPRSYKARSLNGIWATAPYLHNGSVPSLWELLKPSAQRVQQFRVGNRTFDPVNVGFVTTSGGSLLDTSLPGNSNAGHEGPGFDTDLTDAEKWALIEYMKSL